MCEFCHKHGEGRIWYLQARNYGTDLASDLRRRGFIADYFRRFDQPHNGPIARLERIPKMPTLLQRLARGMVTRRMKKEHFGQVLPIEDIETIFGIVNCVVRVPCACRQFTRGKEARYCLGISVDPALLWTNGEAVHRIVGPDGAGVERIEKPDALGMLRELEQEGLVHSVWTFMTPFIGGICNCDRTDCLGLRATVSYRTKVMFKGEYVAEIAPDRCPGCRTCMQQCQFGAISYARLEQKCLVDVFACYGCGICRATCPHDAIRLVERVSVPAVAGDW